MEYIKRVSLFILLTLGCPPITYAHTELSDTWLGNGLLGVSAGYATRKALIQSSITTPTNFSAYSRDSSDNGGLGAIFGGYQVIYRQWLLGAECNLEWQVTEDTHHYSFAQRNITADYRRKRFIDFSGRVGYAFTPNWMPYGRVGVELSRDSLDSTFSGSGFTSMALYNKAWIHRFILGLGAEMPIPGTCGITLRLEYDYHSKGKTIEDFNATGVGSTRIDYYTAMQPRTYSGRLSVVWNFFPQ